MKTLAPIARTEVSAKYPNLVRNVCWTGSITPEQAALVIWAVKCHIAAPVGSDRVKMFGTNHHLVSQAIRYRNA